LYVTGHIVAHHLYLIAYC